MNIITWILESLISKRCFICGKELPLKQPFLCCPACEKLLKASRISWDKRCEKCGRGLNYMYNSTRCSSCTQHRHFFDAAASPFHYDGHIKDAIHKLKFAKKPYIVSALGDEVAQIIPREMIFDYIAYPPLNRKTFYKRGFNQSELLAEWISSKIQVPLLKHALVKKKQNEIQSRMTGKDRFSNVKGVFAVNPKMEKYLENKRILLVDDVLTTGATASECARLLKQKGAIFVFVATIASTREI